MAVGGPVDRERLTMLRDMNAALRAFAKEDVDTVNEILVPYKSDREKTMAAMKVLLEGAASTLSVAADFGLPPRELLGSYLTQVPEDRRAAFRRAADLMLAVHEQSELARQNIDFKTTGEAQGFIAALMNMETWIVRQAAKKTGGTPDEIYDVVAKGLAAQP